MVKTMVSAQSDPTSNQSMFYEWTSDFPLHHPNLCLQVILGLGRGAEALRCADCLGKVSTNRTFAVSKVIVNHPQIDHQQVVYTIKIWVVHLVNSGIILCRLKLETEMD